MTETALPLSGIRILDLTRVLAGPLATMMLGDLGADVIKVERRGSGDESRGWGPPFDARGESAYYLSCNRNKLSVAVNLDEPADQELVRSLAAEAHAVVDNFLPGMLEKRNLDPALLLSRHSHLVWCTITGFGRGSDRPGYDFVVQAEAGWMAITGEPGGAPMKAGVALADVGAGKDAAIAILSSLLGVRGGSAAERRVFISLEASARSSLINVAQNTLVSGSDARRWGNAHANLVPYQLFAARDRDVVLAVGNDAQFASFAGVAGDARLRDERFRTNAQRVGLRDELVPIVAEVLGRRPAAEWLAILEPEGVPCGVVKSVREALSSGESSPVTGIAPSPPRSVRRPPPMLDEHGTLVRAHGWNAFSKA